MAKRNKRKLVFLIPLVLLSVLTLVVVQNCGSSGGPGGNPFWPDGGSTPWPDGGSTPWPDGGMVMADGGSPGNCSTPADLVGNAGCPGQTCTIIDAQNNLGCGPIGTNAAYADCANQQGCAAKTFCAGPPGGAVSCMPFCDLNTGTGCPGTGICSYRFTTAAGDVGLCALPSSCDLLNNGCPSGQACYLASAAGAVLCTTEGTVQLDASCAYTNDCKSGLICAGNPGACKQLCRTNNDCAAISGTTCQGIGQIPGTANATLGICQ